MPPPPPPRRDWLRILAPFWRGLFRFAGKQASDESVHDQQEHHFRTSNDGCLLCVIGASTHRDGGCRQTGCLDAGKLNAWQRQTAGTSTCSSSTCRCSSSRSGPSRSSPSGCLLRDLRSRTWGCFLHSFGLRFGNLGFGSRLFSCLDGCLRGWSWSWSRRWGRSRGWCRGRSRGRLWLA